MFELDFFGLINGAGIEWMVFVSTMAALFTLLSGAIWPLMENWMKKEEQKKLLSVVQETDAEELIRLTREVEEIEAWRGELVRGKRIYEILEWEERINLFHYPVIGRKRWETCVREMEEIESRLAALQEKITLLDYQIDGIWSTPIPV